MDFTQTVEAVGKALDIMGIVVILGGTVLVFGRFLKEAIPAADRAAAYRECRQGTGRAILLGLEFLVAGDIIRTVAISPTFTSVGILAAIVAIRTFLSSTLELEIEGRWPWQKPSG